MSKLNRMMQMDMYKKDKKKEEIEKPIEIVDIYSFFAYLSSNLKAINDSKIFAGLMIIILNISSRFVNLKISKTMESYLKNTFSRQILVFAIAWMGTRDFFVALFITIAFTVVSEYLCNENSAFCILPESFTNYHVSLLEDETECKMFSKEDVQTALKVLEKAKKIIDNSITNTTGTSTGTSIDKMYLYR
jgi:hypothetical protein